MQQPAAELCALLSSATPRQRQNAFKYLLLLTLQRVCAACQPSCLRLLCLFLFYALACLFVNLHQQQQQQQWQRQWQRRQQLLPANKPRERREGWREEWGRQATAGELCSQSEQAQALAHGNISLPTTYATDTATATATWTPSPSPNCRYGFGFRFCIFFLWHLRHALRGQTVLDAAPRRYLPSAIKIERHKVSSRWAARL